MATYNLTTLDAWSDSFSPFLGMESGLRFYRAQAIGQNGYQFFLSFSTDVSGFDPAGFNPANITIFVQDRIGEVVLVRQLDFGATTGFVTSAGNTLFNFGWDTSASTPTIKAGLLWFDYTGSSYSVKYQAARLIADDIINIDELGEPIGELKTLLSGVSAPDDWGWNSTSTNFVLMTDNAIAGTSNKTIQIRGFDIDGKALSSQSLIVPKSTYTTLVSLPDGRHALVQEDNSSPNNAALIFKAFDASTGSLETAATISSQMKNVTAVNFTSINDPSNSSIKNTMMTVSGQNAEGRNGVNFLLLDPNGQAISSFFLATNNAPGRIQEISLIDNQTTITGFQDGQTIHLVQVNGLGQLVIDKQISAPANAYFDRLRNLGDGRFEVVWREPADNSTELVIKAKIYDTRAEGTPITSTSGNNILAGTKYADTIDGGNGNDVIAGGGGADSLAGGSGIDTLSYATSGISVNVNLSSNSVSGGAATGDVISGFENLIGSEAGDVLTGDNNTNIIFGGYGNDTMSGLDANDRLFGQAGNDTIDGGNGIDEAVYSGTSYDYQITKISSGYIIKDLRAGSPDGTDTLSKVELFEFSDGTAAPSFIRDIEPWSDSASIFASVEAGSYLGRLATFGYGGNQFFAGFTTKGSTYNYNNISEGSVLLITQDRVGNVLTYQDLEIPISIEKGMGGTSSGVSLVTFGLDTTKSNQTIKAGLLWLDYAGGNYNLNFKAIDYTPNDSINTGEFYSVAEETKTIATNLVSPNIIDWSSNNTSFVYVTETVSAGSSTKSIKLLGFDTAGNLSATKAFEMPVGAYRGLFNDPLGNYILLEENNDDPNDAQLTGKLFDPTTGSLDLVASLATGLKDIGAAFFTSVSAPTNSSQKNNLFAISGVESTGKNVVQFMLTDSEQNILKTFSVETNFLVPRFQQSTLLDGTSTITAYQDGQALQIIRVDGFGSFVDSETIDLPTGAIFDRVRNFNDGRFEVIWREPGAEINEFSYKFQIFDTRPEGYPISSNANNNLLSGTNYADSIDGGEGNDVISGGRLGDVLKGGNGIDTLSYANSNTGVTVNLNTNTASGGNATGDVISGFEHLAGSNGADSLTGNGSTNIIVGYAGNDSIYGLGGDDILFGEAGNDLIDGGTGSDFTSYTHQWRDYQFTKTSNGFTVKDLRNGSPDGTDTLVSIEKVSFADARVYDSLSKYYTITYKKGSLDVFSKLMNAIDEDDIDVHTFVFSDQNLDMSYFEKTATLSQSAVKSLVELYIASFNRAPDAMGLNYWGSQLASGAMDLGQIAKSFFVQPETVAAYPSSQSVEFFVDRVYNNVLSRSPDGSGMAYWKEAIESGRIGKDVFLLAIINGAKAETGSAQDKQTLINKTLVGMDYAFQEGLSNVTWAKDVMASVNSTSSSVQDAYQKTDGYALKASTSATAELAVKVVGVWDSASL